MVSKIKNLLFLIFLVLLISIPCYATNEKDFNTSNTSKAGSGTITWEEAKSVIDRRLDYMGSVEHFRDIEDKNDKYSIVYNTDNANKEASFLLYLCTKYNQNYSIYKSYWERFYKEYDMNGIKFPECSEDEYYKEISNSIEINEGLTPNQQTVINACKIVMESYMTSLEDDSKSRENKTNEACNYYDVGKYIRGWNPAYDKIDNHGNGSWYGQSKAHSDHTKEEYDKGDPIIYFLSFNILNKVYNARPDCSSYVNAVLIRLGADFASTGYGTGDMTKLPESANDKTAKFIIGALKSDKFKLYKYDISKLEPGDIVIKSGHTEVFYNMVDSTIDASNGNWPDIQSFSWGSTASVRLCYDYNSETNVRTLLKEPKIHYDYKYYRNGYKDSEYILRYVGSGGKQTTIADWK